jgi:hypothetical protein
MRNRARLCLRWEAIGPDGALYPALDADLTLASAGETITLLTLAGVYRLPGQAAAELHPAEVRCAGAGPSARLSPGSPAPSCIPLAQRASQECQESQISKRLTSNS